MKNTTHKLSAILLSLIMLWGMLPVAVFAQAPVYDAGSCGANLSYSFTAEDGKLVITGTGAITSSPWSSYRADIKSIALPEGLTAFCNGAFSYCSQIKEILIPDSVTAVGTEVFYYCTSLERAVIGDGVISIGDSAFYGCTALAEVTIGASVTSIQHSTAYCHPAFCGCTNLKKVINKSMLPIIAGDQRNTNGDVAKYAEAVEFDWHGSCGEGLTWTLNNGDFILRISGTGTMDSRPWSEMAGVIKGVELEEGITSICHSAFSGFKELKGIEIPRTVTNMGDYAFSDCVGLREILIPDSVTAVGKSVFFNCSSLEKAVIGDGVTSIGDGAFYGCKTLGEVTIGASVTSIQHETAYCYPAFCGCTSLKKVINKSMLPIIAGDKRNTNGNVAKFAEAVEFDWHGSCGEDLTWTLNNGDFILRIFGTGAMDSRPWSEMASVIKGVELEEGITSICHSAFSGFTQLENIEIPRTVTRIDNNAFSDCVSLREILIPDSVTVMGTWVFNNCKALKKAVIGNALKRIEEGAFKDCSELAEVSIGKSVNFIRSNSNSYWAAFSGCKKLSEIYNYSELILSAGAETNGGVAQYATSVYKSIEGKAVNVEDTVYNGGERKQAVTVEGLIEGTDFDVTYSGDCLNAGTVTVTVTGKGDYFGTLTAAYVIAKAQRTEAPPPPEAKSIGKNSITLTAVAGCEYSIDGTAWQNGNVFEGLTLATAYTFSQRYRATENYGASSASSAEISTHVHTWDSLWTSDLTHHWHKCTGCDDITEKESHHGDAPTCTAAQLCTKCQHTMQNALGHSYIRDEARDIPADTASTGIEAYSCIYCGKHSDRTTERLREIEIIRKTSSVKIIDKDTVAIPMGMKKATLRELLPSGVELSEEHGENVLYTGMKVTLRDAAGRAVDTMTVVVMGDVDGNGLITAADARLALRKAVGLEELKHEQTEAAKVANADGVKAAQARLILRAAVGLVSPEELFGKAE